MNVNEVFPSKYLKASDLGEARPIVTIDHVSVELVGKQQDKRPVAYFAGKTKGLVLNKTNAKAISVVAGSDETDDWSGVKVQLFATMVEFAGDQVEAIRVKAPQKPKAAKPEPEPEPEPTSDDFSDGDDRDPIPF